MKRLQRKKPWYKNTAGICSIAAVVIALGVVLFFVLRGSGEKEPEVPDMPPVEEPTPEPEPAPNPPEEPEQTIFSQGEVTDGVWNLILVNPWNPMPENYSVELEEISGGGVDKRCYPQLQKMMDDCRAQGYSPYICSSFRTWDLQQRLFNNQIQEFIDQG